MTPLHWSLRDMWIGHISATVPSLSWFWDLMSAGMGGRPLTGTGSHLLANWLQGHPAMCVSKLFLELPSKPGPHPALAHQGLAQTGSRRAQPCRGHCPAPRRSARLVPLVPQWAQPWSGSACRPHSSLLRLTARNLCPRAPASYSAPTPGRQAGRPAVCGPCLAVINSPHSSSSVKWVHEGGFESMSQNVSKLPLWGLCLSHSCTRVWHDFITILPKLLKHSLCS